MAVNVLMFSNSFPKIVLFMT